jgi:hypothetical protein
MTIPKAIKTLTDALKNDPAYRQTWVANIAMSFYDEQNSRKGVLPHEWNDVANKAAERFLDLLCS